MLVDGQRSKGLELALSGSLTPRWSVIGGYAYQDAVLTATVSASAKAGAKLAQVPPHTFSLWNRYDVADRWGLGVGVIHKADMFTSTDNTVTFDNVAPTVTINQGATQADPAVNATSIAFDVVFNESVTGFTGSDVALSGTAGGTLIADVAGSGTTYTVTVTGMTTTGTVIADVDAGATWKQLVQAAVPLGATCPVLTGYINLSIGGTLAVGGISPNYRRGAQVDRVRELWVVTGRGDLEHCSMRHNRRLFEAVLAGLGQCGIVVRVVMDMIPAPTSARTLPVCGSSAMRAPCSGAWRDADARRL